MNPFAVLPPINPGMSMMTNNYNNSADHIVAEPTNKITAQSVGGGGSDKAANETYLPVEPIHLNPQEEQALIADVKREFRNFSYSQIKQFYAALSEYDKNKTGFVHHTYINLVAMRINVNYFQVYKREEEFLNLFRLVAH